MAVVSRDILYTAPSDVDGTNPVRIKATVTIRGTGNRARVGTAQTAVFEDFNVVSIINDVTAICPGDEYEFTATVISGHTVSSYEWFPGDEGSIKGSNTEQTVTYVAPSDFPFCVYGSIRIKVTLDNGDILEDTERFIIPPSLLSINSWNDLDIIPDNKPVGLHALLLGIEEIEQTPEDEVQYDWSADSGSFSGSGERAKFTHPTVSEPTLVKVNCEVRTSEQECGKATIDYLVVPAQDVGVSKEPEERPSPPAIPKGPTNQLNPIPTPPPIPAVQPFPDPPPIDPVQPFPDPPPINQVEPLPQPPPLPPVRPLPPELVPLVPPSELCLIMENPLLAGEEHELQVIPSSDGDWDSSSSHYLSASAVGSFSGSTFTAPETPERGVQIHCVIKYEGLDRRVIREEQYIEGTITRDVVARNGALAAPNSVAIRATKADGSEFDPNTDSLDVCDSLYLEAVTQGGNYDQIDTDYQTDKGELELPDAVAPGIVLTSIDVVYTDMNQMIMASAIGGEYDGITFDWDIIGPGLIGSGSGPSRIYIPPRTAGEFANVTIICVATVTGTGTNAKAGTSATARVAQVTFQVVGR